MNSRSDRAPRSSRALIGGVIGLGVAAFFAWQSIDLGIGTFRSPGAGLWPLLVAVVMAVAALISCFSPVIVEDWATSTDVRRVLLGIGSIVVFVVLFPLVGFLLPALACVVIWLRLLMPESWRVVLAVAAVTTLLWVAFRFGLAVPLPAELGIGG